MIQAEHGKESKRTKIIGESGHDIFINVPTGIEILYKSGEIMGTLNNTGEKMIVCRGGVGGGPLNNYIAKPGEHVPIVLNLKVA